MHIGETLTQPSTTIAGSLVELCFEQSSVMTNEWTTCGVTLRHESEAQNTLTAMPCPMQTFDKANLPQNLN